jgi:hypothetical protein
MLVAEETDKDCHQSVIDSAAQQNTKKKGETTHFGS